MRLSYMQAFAWSFGMSCSSASAPNQVGCYECIFFGASIDSTVARVPSRCWPGNPIQAMIDMLKSRLTNTDDDTHSFMIWLSLVYLTMISQVLVYVSLRFRPNAAAMEQMDSS